MTAENWILAILAGFVVAWIANAVSKSRYSFPVNMVVGIFGAGLLNFFLRTAGIINDSFFEILMVSIGGSIVLLAMFHLTRAIERR